MVKCVLSRSSTLLAVEKALDFGVESCIYIHGFMRHYECN